MMSAPLWINDLPSEVVSFTNVPHRINPMTIRIIITDSSLQKFVFFSIEEAVYFADQKTKEGLLRLLLVRKFIFENLIYQQLNVELTFKPRECSPERTTNCALSFFQ